MKFQKAAFRAATLRADERAPAAVSLPHSGANVADEWCRLSTVPIESL